MSLHLFDIRHEVSKQTKVLLAVLSWSLVVLVWFLLTQWDILPPFSVPKPVAVVKAFIRLWTDYDLLGNVFMSWWRIGQAFLWSAAIAIPLGLLMGSFRWLHSFINPIAEPMRSMPITAFVPAFIGLFGMEEGMKVGFLFFGMFFYLLALVVEEADRVDNALLETAMTLGARKPQLLWLMFRASFPAIFGSFRILYDIGWTYVILAEMVNARKGVGYMVEAARKVLDFDRVYAGIIAIGVAAFLSASCSQYWKSNYSRGAGPPDNRPHRLSRGLLQRRKRMPGKAKVSLHNVARSFVSPTGETIQAIHDINFEIEDNFSPDGRDVGEFRVLLGPSGCGKSTILRLIAGLDHPDTGEVLVNGVPVTGPGRDRGMVFQKYTSFPWLTVAQNIEYGMKINHFPEQERRQTVERLIEAVGLAGFASSYPDTLSGGMQQRVAIARTLALRPSVILMDEPFGALDAQTRADMQELLLRIWGEAASTVLFVTHDVDEAIYLADHIFVLCARPGTIIEDVPVPFGRPRDPSMKLSQQFRDMQQHVLASLRHSPGSGQVRVNI